MKPVLLLLGGWAYGTEALSPLADLLAQRFTVRLFDTNSLFERDPGQPGWDDPLRAELLREPRPRIVAGWSLGGMVALDALDQEPFAHPPLALISSTAKFCAGEDYPHGQSPGAIRAMEAGLRSQPDRTLALFHAQCADPHAALDLASPRSPTPGDTPALRRGLAYLRTRDLRAAAARYPAIIQLLHGAVDSIIPFAAARFLEAHAPRARLSDCPGIGHDLPLRDPPWVADRILTLEAETA